ncbi:MAGUK p55 subfamily member 7-like isoform X4 [Dendroctonus ponderosae]|uniref:MAGUK p55 subfamily member 7 isoform X4 n=1 Tax=Dendroctonus ponderosae TaxID=77166 RepID=UPI002035A029|nr:MAGUK p55 subfamily member 7 isoform X4 [Dendroctonus ponderosae]XP_048525705.1 MAGUK p55 subfamily member 7-like isoform X4 [Dendroctonus ponderosae]
MTSEVMENDNKTLDSGTLTDLFVNLQKSSALLSTEEEQTFLNGLLQSKELNALVNIHSKILSNVERKRFFPVPALSDGMQVLADVLELIYQQPRRSSDCQELFLMLQKPHLQGLLCAHDAIAQKDYYPRLPDIPVEDDEEEQTIKVVQLVKSNEPLTGTQSAEPIVGATIKTDELTGKIVIARVMHGGAADRSGLIHVGDEVVEVNAISVEGKEPNDVLDILQSSEGTITFKLVPAECTMNVRESKVRVRAHFDYDSSTDPYIPCKEAGLDFKKGDVLHIVCQDDQYWWQARKEGDKHMRAGLIPSRALQEKRIVHDRGMKKDEDEVAEEGLSCSPEPVRCLLGADNKNKTKKIIYDTAENDDFDRELIATYEEVAKLYPRPSVFRPIVLIGPPGVGRNELKRRLIDTDPVKFQTPTPFTSRSMKPGEVDGKEYFFVTRQQMERDIDEGKFIEFGEYKGNLYGTSTSSVEAIVHAGLVCILNPHYQALKMLRTPLLKPYIIYISPPSLDVLKQTRMAHHARSTFDVNNSRGFTEDEFQDMIRHSERIKFLYDHFFDETIVNADLADAFSKLLAAVNRVESEPLWVPASWVQ